MSQATLNGDKYQNQSALKAAMTLESSMIQVGLLKPESMEEAFHVCESYTKRFVDLLIEGDTESLTKQGFNEGERKQPSNASESESSGSSRASTERQQKAMFVITHTKIDKKWEKNDKHEFLTKDIKDYSFNEASEFIETYGGR